MISIVQVAGTKGRPIAGSTETRRGGSTGTLALLVHFSSHHHQWSASLLLVPFTSSPTRYPAVRWYMPGWSWYPTSNAVNSPGLAAPSGPSPPLAVQTPYSARPDLFPVSHTRALSGDPSIHSSSAPSPPSKLHARSSERAASSASSKTTRTVAERGAGVQCGHRMPSSAGLVAIVSHLPCSSSGSATPTDRF